MKKLLNYSNLRKCNSLPPVSIKRRFYWLSLVSTYNEECSQRVLQYNTTDALKQTSTISLMSHDYAVLLKGFLPFT